METNIEKILHMNGGHEEHSYAQNSSYQRNGLRFLRPFLEECISQMKIIPSACERFCIADLGCSAGPNTLFVAETISNAVQKKYMEMESRPMPDLQVFFSDLPSNDFNSLFQSLSLKSSEDSYYNSGNGGLSKSKYFAAAVAGSFHKRLFPKNSLHFVHSSYSLHWLSRVPAEIEDKNSRCWNGPRVVISEDTPEEVAEAYVRQFCKDFNSFLRARAEEVVGEGRMFLFLLGRASSDPRDQGAISTMGNILNAAFHDMVSQGVIEEEKRDSFNLPFFAPSVDELRSEVEKEGSFIAIRIEFLKGVRDSQQANMDMETEDNRSAFGRMAANHFRAILEGLVSSHFGAGVVNPLFERFAARVAEKASEASKFFREGGGILAVLERAETS
uniref:Uncharacterized protein n=1 Tax=Araucaria cunninghamii TaxID=56994 RepID=A0A0D6QV44_ARACU